MSPEVAAAYGHCRVLARNSGTSFYTGMLLLPADRRAAMFAVYALARRIDDVADGPADAETRLRQLEEIRIELGTISEATGPVLRAVADVLDRYPVPLAAFVDLIDGAVADVRGTEYETFAELEIYCRRVAGSIGRLSLGIFGTPEPELAARLADDLGVALQIGNILRDVREDTANGRLYLPREDLDRFGCSYEDGVFTGPIELVLAFEAQRGLGYLDRGLHLLDHIDRRSAACVLAMSGGYRRYLTRIAVEPTLALGPRLSLSPWEKTVVVARSLARGLS